jgi:lipopolysaccharide biosynthesis protein
VEENFKIGVVAHFFYLEQAKTIAEFLKHIPFEFVLYASVSEEQESEMRSLLQAVFPGKKIVLRMVPDRGFDIAPFVDEFKDCYTAYDLVLKVHTKKSSHVEWLRDWCSYLLKNLIGSSDIVRSIVKMFQNDEKLGIIYPEVIPSLKDSLIDDPWQENWKVCRDLSVRLGLSVKKDQHLNFPAGSMFWFKPKALEQLFKLRLKTEDFPQGRRIRRNGTLAHAIERLFVLIAEKQGFSARQVCFVPYDNDTGKISFHQKIRRKIYELQSIAMDFLGFYR